MEKMVPSDRYDSLISCYAAWEQNRDDSWRRRPVPLDPSLLKAQAIAESNLNPRAVSKAGAQGLTQFMPPTWTQITGSWTFPADPFNPEHAIRAQAIFMGDLLELWKGDVRRALASYNAGQGRVKRMIAEHEDAWMEAMPKETRDYVARIHTLYKDLTGTDLA